MMDGRIIKSIRSLRERGYSIVNISMKIGRSIYFVRYVCSRYNIPSIRKRHIWTEEEYTQIEQMYNDCKTAKEIASFFGVTETAIIGRIMYLRSEGYNMPYRRNFYDNEKWERKLRENMRKRHNRKK